MLIHPWDAAPDPDEWRGWLAASGRFGLLTVNNLDPAQAPVVVPTHFTVSGEALLLHLARPNPVWPHVEAAPEVRLVVVGDYAFIPGYWRTGPGQPAEHGVPTSYYTAVQLVCRPTVVDDPHEKAELLTAQLADLQPEGGHAPVVADAAPYGRDLPGIRGVRLQVLRVEAKFKYDDQKPVAHRRHVTEQLRQRGQGLDAGAAAQQSRRLATIGDWKASRNGRRSGG